MASSADPIGTGGVDYSHPDQPSTMNTMAQNNINVGGQNLTTENPAYFSPQDLNPSAAGYTQGLQGLMGGIMNNTPGGQALQGNSGYYQNMMGIQGQGIQSMMGNQYARMGLQGSSAEMGGMSQALTQNQLAWTGKEQSDALQSAQGISSLDQAAYGQTMGIQNQYGNYENTANQDILSALGYQSSQQQANNQMFASIFGTLGGALGPGGGGSGGSAFGGGGGAAAGGSGAAAGGGGAAAGGGGYESAAAAFA